MNRICHLCGTHYKEDVGHPANHCWGIIHQQLLNASAMVWDWECKLKEANNRIDEEKPSKSKD